MEKPNNTDGCGSAGTTEHEAKILQGLALAWLLARSADQNVHSNARFPV